MSESSMVLHLALFGRALRERGVAVSLSDEVDGLAALTLIDLGDRDELRHALRSALKIRPRDAAAFAELFDRLWSALAGLDGAPPNRFTDPHKPPRPASQRPPRAPRPASAAALPPPRDAAGAPPELPDPPEITVREGRQPAYSPESVLRRKPFDECSAAELQAMERLMARLSLRLATRPSRRRVPVQGRGEVDLRRSFRRAVAQGGEFRSLARRARPIERPRLVVLCDTSGSMDPHSRFLLSFVLALRQAVRAGGAAGRTTEVFAFNTRLVRLTPWLREAREARRPPQPRPGGTARDAAAPHPPAGGPGAVETALERLARRVPDWSGGTKIGECLAEFATVHLDPLVDAKTVVLVMSDGLDRGDVAPLAWALRAIRSRARRLLWLNPLAGDRRYEPTARAMAAALPHIDRLLPAHNLEALERLLPLLTV
jgi:uncharacterized protein with von Willebrand factor type A (vWA) domain